MRSLLSFLNNNSLISKPVVLGNFLILNFTGVLFRSNDLSHASTYYQAVLNQDFFGLNDFILAILPLSLGFMIFEWYNQKKSHPFDLDGYPTWLRRSLYVIMILAVFLFGYFGTEPFYYFQF